MALCLLEAGANVDQRNQQKQTPLFSACEGLQRNLAHVCISVKGSEVFCSQEIGIFDENLSFMKWKMQNLNQEKINVFGGLLFQLLIEWGCDVHAKNQKGQAAFETIKNDEFRDFLIGTLLVI